jgi:hypothetical protein
LTRKKQGFSFLKSKGESPSLESLSSFLLGLRMGVASLPISTNAIQNPHRRSSRAAFFFGTSTQKRARNHHAFHTEVPVASVVLGAFGGGREDGTRCIVPAGETSFGHAGAVVNDEGQDTIAVAHAFVW